MTDYARQLAAHPRWVWQPGMVTANGHAVSQDDLDDEFSPAGVRPDIHHPATRGWLLHMLREATAAHFGDALDEWAGVYVERMDDGTWRSSASPGAEWHPTEGAALASALLAVWGAS